MPTQMEDATPLDAYSLDVQYSSGFENGTEDVVVQRPNIRYGLSDQMQLESQATIYSGGDEDQSGETDFNVLYRFNKSTNLMPEVSISPSITFPTGKRIDSVDYGVRFNLTSTLRGTSDHPLTQIHFNYHIEHNNNPATSDIPDLSAYILGISHLLLSETSVVFDGVISTDLTGQDSYLLELGLHHHLGNEFYLGLSASLGLGASDIKQMGALALEKQF